MRDNVRCLVCGSSRYATFRTSSTFPSSNINQPSYYVDSPPKKVKDDTTSTSSKKTIYQTDYDLIRANEQFKKLLSENDEASKDAEKENSSDEENEVEAKRTPSIEEITKSLHKVRADEPVGPLYDKSKSFFDDISCESKEKSDGSYAPRQWQAERSRNQQTFGLFDGSRGYNPRFMNSGGNQFRGFPNMMHRSGNSGFYQQRNNTWQQQERLRNQQTFGSMASSYGHQQRHYNNYHPNMSGGYYQQRNKWQMSRGNYGPEKELFADL